MGFNFCTYFIVLLCLLFSAKGTKIDFDDYALDVNTISTVELGMFSKTQTPFGHDNSYVSWDLKFQNVTSTGGTTTLLLFHDSLYNLVGKELQANERFYCCWQEQVDQGECSNPGYLLADDQLWNHVGDLFQYANVVSMNETFNLKELTTDFIITQKGYWRFWIIYCGQTEDSTLPTITLNGNQHWVNPYGELPATIFGYLPMYWILALLYFSFGVYWAFLSWKHRNDLLFLQNWASFIIGIAFLEAIISGSDYLVYNHTGVISLGFNVVTVLISVTKRIASYVGLVLVTSGVTIIKPTLEPRLKKALIVFVLIYLAFSASYQFVDMLSYTPSSDSNIPASADTALLILQTICDFLWLLWIFRSYFQSLSYLQKHNQPVKLTMFKRLGIVLLIAYIVSFVLYIAEYSILINGTYDSDWQSFWFFDGYWYVMHFIMTCVIGYMWRPNVNNSRYAYSFQLNDGNNVNSEEMSDNKFEIGNSD